MAEENEDLKKEKNTPGNESDPENDPSGKEPLKNTGEEEEEEKKSPEEEAEELLKDGTPVNKDIKVSKKTYDDKNVKAKLYEAHAVLLDKVLQQPDLVEKFLEGEKKEDLEARMGRLEEEKKNEKRKEIREAVVEALSIWPDFKKAWPEVQPIAKELAKSGTSFREALKRGYFAVNPEAAATEKERIARENVNALGTFPSMLGHSPNIASIKAKSGLTDIQKRIFNSSKNMPHMPKTEEGYAELLEKHKEWLDNFYPSSVR